VDRHLTTDHRDIYLDRTGWGEGKVKVSIVIPFYGKWELVHARLMELWSHSLQKHPDSEVILIDDASPDAKKPSDEYLGGVKWWQDGLLANRLRYFRNKDNLGFGGSMNKGAKIAIRNGANAIILLSNDVTVMGDIVKDVATLLELDRNIVIGGEVLYNDTGWNNLENCGVVPYANGWFLAFDAGVWEQLGGFDPAYGKFDYEDLDLSTTAQLLGMKLVPIATKLRHAGGQTIKDLPRSRMDQTMKNRVIWRQKWADKAAELKQKIYGQQAGSYSICE
jgi:GT2 family glycosyltransferase